MLYPGDDNSSGISSGSSACVSDAGVTPIATPLAGTRNAASVTAVTARDDVASAPAKSRSSFSVFGEKLDLFMEIMQTTQHGLTKDDDVSEETDADQAGLPPDRAACIPDGAEHAEPKHDVLQPHFVQHHQHHNDHPEQHSVGLVSLSQTRSRLAPPERSRRPITPPKPPKRLDTTHLRGIPENCEPHIGSVDIRAAQQRCSTTSEGTSSCSDVQDVPEIREEGDGMKEGLEEDVSSQRTQMTNGSWRSSDGSDLQAANHGLPGVDLELTTFSSSTLSPAGVHHRVHHGDNQLNQSNGVFHPSNQSTDALDRPDQSELTCGPMSKSESISSEYSQSEASYHNARETKVRTSGQYDSMAERERQRRLLRQLQELHEWVVKRETEMSLVEPLSTDLETLHHQKEEVQSVLRDMDEREPLVSSHLESARTVTTGADPSACDSSGTPGTGTFGRGGRTLSRSLSRQTSQLQQRWRHLCNTCTSLRGNIDSAIATVEDLDAALQEAERRVGQLSDVHGDAREAEDDDEDGRAEQLDQLRSGTVAVNELVQRLKKDGVLLSDVTAERLRRLTGQLQALTPGTVSDTASAHGDLTQSVAPPWQRSLTEDGLPYYMNHERHTTQWEHPRFGELISSMKEFDTVRFSAYRTALKLRKLQRSLHLHRLPLDSAIAVFSSEESNLPATGDISVPELELVVSELYSRLEPETLHSDESQQGRLDGIIEEADAPREDRVVQVDMCISWLLGVFDEARSGQIPTSALKVAVTALCSARLEHKYRYLFQQLSDEQTRRLDERQLSTLLHQLLKIPAQVGEGAAFSEATVEASVASCFRTVEAEADASAAGTQPTMDEQQVFSWLRQEPQPVVWLNVLHRLSASEAAVHRTRCSGCKRAPFTGLRYRCLKCFNLDLCQQCFFVGRVSRSHKLSHPMHEYCTESSATDELRDWTAALRNRFRSRRRMRTQTQLGYLPVQPAAAPAPSSPRPDIVLERDLLTRCTGRLSPLGETATTPAGPRTSPNWTRRWPGSSSPLNSRHTPPALLLESFHSRRFQNSSPLASSQSPLGQGRLPASAADDDGSEAVEMKVVGSGGLYSPPGSQLHDSFSNTGSEEELHLIAQYCLDISGSDHHTSTDISAPQLREIAVQLERENAELLQQFSRLSVEIPPSSRGRGAGVTTGALNSHSEEFDDSGDVYSCADQSAANGLQDDEADDAAQEMLTLRARVQRLDQRNRELERALGRVNAKRNPGTHLTRSTTLQTRSVVATHLDTGT